MKKKIRPITAWAVVFDDYIQRLQPNEGQFELYDNRKTALANRVNDEDKIIKVKISPI